MSRPWALRQPREPRPFSLAPLARRLGIDPGHTAELSLRFRKDRRSIMRYRAIGLTLRQADEWCDIVDVHPAEVWPIWDELDRLRGVALVNAGKESCVHGHPLDRVNNRGERWCSTCHAFRRSKKSVKSLLTGHIHRQEAS